MNTRDLQLTAATAGTGHRNVETWPLDKLKVHPKQATYFAESTPREVQELAALLKRDGLINPVEILRDGTVICGHRRKMAGELLGWTEISVWVRDDLEAQGPVAVERRLIEDNTARRQLDRMDIARLAIRLHELIRRGNCPLALGDSGEVRDRIGQQFGMSGRNLHRLMTIVLRAPVEVQFAVSAGRVTLELATTVSNLQKKIREQIGNEIRAGGDPETVITSLIPKKGPGAKVSKAAAATLAKSLDRTIAILQSRLADGQASRHEEMDALRKLHDLIDEVLKPAETTARSGRQQRARRVAGVDKELAQPEASAPPLKVAKPTAPAPGKRAKRVRHDRSLVLEIV